MQRQASICARIFSTMLSACGPRITRYHVVVFATRRFQLEEANREREYYKVDGEDAFMREDSKKN
mgnify:CR=1 FL=1